MAGTQTLPPPAPNHAEPSAVPWWRGHDGRVTLHHGDSLEVLAALPANSFDLIFADPPYFLSNGGFTCQNGKRAQVHKGGWDRSQGADANHEFNRSWLEACQRLLTPNGTIWISGTSHVIFSVGFALAQLGFKLLNQVTWEKPNPPPNLSCRYFTHSTETILWAAKNSKSKHYFDYPAMRKRNQDRQMKDVWRMVAPSKGEKTEGRHPTQKPLALLDRILEASCPAGSSVLDPFNGSGTTGVAAVTRGLRYSGIDLDETYLALTKRRLLKLDPSLAEGSLSSSPRLAKVAGAQPSDRLEDPTSGAAVQRHLVA